jgi:hypothetical protein
MARREDRLGRGPRVPFAWLEGRPYLIVNYELEPTGDLPPLRQLLDGLLAHHDEDDVLLLRPLGKAQEQLLKQATAGAAIETWAQMIVKPEDRYRPRPRSTRWAPRRS